MENHLLRTVKFRIFDELQGVINKNSLYREKIKVWHKYPYKEREHMGVYMRNISGTRVQLSADDFAGTLKSHLALACVENYESSLLEWVWEDETNMTVYQENEDLSSQITGATRLFNVSHYPIISGPHNTVSAVNAGQVTVLLNGSKIYSDYINGDRGYIMLPYAPALGSTLTVSYYYNNLTRPGRYYIRLVDESSYDISPIYEVDGKTIISRTTGAELTANLGEGNLLAGFDVLYTFKSKYSYRIYLERDIDYTIDNTTGIVTFINSLPIDTTLYANYRVVGEVLGPFSIPDDFQYINNALNGVILAFGNQRVIGDQQVILVSKNREPAASVYSGHWNLSLELEVFGRDPIQLPDLTDVVITGLWARRNPLISEGYTITGLEPTGEVEEVYVDGTNDQYYKNTINLLIMTEWKSLKALTYKLRDFNTAVYMAIKEKDYVVNNQGVVLQLNLVPPLDAPSIISPTIGYPRYF